MRARRIIGWLVVTMAAAPAFADEKPASEPATLSIIVHGLRNAKGQIGCMLYASADGFPRDPAKARQRLLVPIYGDGDGDGGVCRFVGLPAGRYAVVAMHDENGNGVMDRSLLGIPKEGFGASRGAHGTFGPKFADAAFDYGGGAAATSITIRY